MTDDTVGRMVRVAVDGAEPVLVTPGNRWHLPRYTHGVIQCSCGLVVSRCRCGACEPRYLQAGCATCSPKTAKETTMTTMTIERQALVERLRKLATERATNGGGNDPCPPEAECDDCDSVRAMREAADALEALSSSAHVETPLVATDAESEPHKPKIRVHETMGGFWRVVVSGRDENQDDRYALMPLGRGDTRAEAVANARIWFAQIDPAAPADPPIPSPGDEERKDEIATSAAQRWWLAHDSSPDLNVPESLTAAFVQALSDYEIKAGGK